jgi:hypothetical protein
MDDDEFSKVVKKLLLAKVNTSYGDHKVLNKSHKGSFDHLIK